MKFYFFFACFSVLNQFYAKTVLRLPSYDESFLDVVSSLLINGSGKSNDVMNFLVETSRLNIRNFCNEIILKVMQSNKVSVTLETKEKIIKSENVVRKENIFIINSENFTKTFNDIVKPENYKFKGHFIFVFLEFEFEKVQEVIDFMWKKRIASVEIIVQERNEKVLVFSFLPFTTKICNNTSPIIIKEFENGKLLKTDKNFYSKKFNNLHNCPIRVGVTQNKPYIFKKESKGLIKLSGREIDLVKELSRVLKFKAEFVYVNESGSLHANGSATGTFKMLMENKVDLILGNNNLKPNRLQFIENSTPYITSQISFLIPPGQPLTSFERLFSPLRMKVWICMFVYFLFGMIVIFIIKRQSRNVSNFVFGENVHNPYMNMLNAIFGGSQKVEPSRNFSRFLLMMFLAFCLILRTLYCGSLYRFLQADIHHLEVESIDEMLRKDFKFYVSTSSLDLFEGDPKFNGR